MRWSSLNWTQWAQQLKGFPFQVRKIQQPAFTLDVLKMFQHALAGKIPGTVDTKGALTIFKFTNSLHPFSFAVWP